MCSDSLGLSLVVDLPDRCEAADPLTGCVLHTSSLGDSFSLFGLLEGAKPRKFNPIFSHIKDDAAGLRQGVIFMCERCHHVNQAGQLD